MKGMWSGPDGVEDISGVTWEIQRGNISTW